MLRETKRIPMDRRDLLKTIGLGTLAAGAAMLPDVVRAQEGPAAAVEDRGSSIRITELIAAVAAGRVFLRLNTNHRISGWGEIKGIEPNVAATLARSLFELLDGENPTRIEFLWQKLYRAHRNIRGGAFMVHTISAIDMALWDIAGKLWREPVWRLLGGPCRDKIRMYPSATAVKLGIGPQEFALNPAGIQNMVNSVKQAREKVGPNGAVMFDAHGALPPPTVIQFANAIEPYDVLFIEEPWVPGNIEVCKKIRAATKVPLATGERDRTIWGMIPYLQEQVVDIVQPDCGYGGGISQMKKVAAIAEAYYVPLAPHNTQSYLGLTASLHVAASVPLFLIHEGYDDAKLGEIARRHWEKDKDGYASLPEGVGLCVDIGEAALAKAAAEPAAGKQWNSPRLPDGSVADY